MTNLTSGSVTPFTPYVSVDNVFSQIEDDTETTGRQPKECKHVRYELHRAPFNACHAWVVSNPDPNLWNFQATGKGACEYLYYVQNEWPHWALEGHNRIVAQYELDERTHIMRAISDYYKFSEVDTLLNILEAPEIPSSIASFLALNNAAKKGLWNVLRKTSGAYLGYAFGIAPLISDLQKIYKGLDSLKSRLEEWDKRAGKLSVQHRKMEGKIDIVDPSHPESRADTNTFVIRGQLCNALRCVTIRGHRGIDTSGLLRRLEYLLRRFGTAGPFNLVWELIPFSFVMDWFIDTSMLFNQLDNLITGDLIQIEDIQVSYTEQYQSLAYLRSRKDGKGWASDLDGQRESWHIARRYHRYQADKMLYLTLSGRFGKKQGLLTAALITQALKRPRAKR